MRRTRRGLLAAIGAGTAALAGCSGAISDPDSTPPSETVSPAAVPTDEPTRSTTATTDDRPTLSADLPGSELPASPTDRQSVAMGCNNENKVYFFSPSLAWLQPGATLQWGLASDCRQQSLAYHPANDRPLRIPREAEPWDGPLMQGTGTFEHTFSVPGVYDIAGLFEAAGQVSCVVVGEPSLADQPAMTDPGDGVPTPALENLERLHAAVRERLG